MQTPATPPEPPQGHPIDARRERPRDTREAILEAALDLFVEGGYHGTSVPQIAERAGIAAGTIYRHFEGKEALVNTLYREQKRAMMEATLGGLAATPGAPARVLFRRLWQELAGFARDRPRAFAFLELHHHASYLDAASQALEDQLTELGCALIAPLQAKEELKPVPAKLLVSLVLGALTGMVRAAREGHLTLDDATIDAAERCCWELVRG
ncbi:MAG: TetR/AcrR family transcriptional regulator [Myxococcales bacterium]|nr:TetR/AcrR family transcriptional regulator [Myxococcales bacterium]